MVTTWVRTLLVCSTMAAVSACGQSPTAPQTPAPSTILRQGESATIPGTDLQVTVRGLATAASIDCVAGVPCNLTPIAFLDLKVPSAAGVSAFVRLPNADGGDSAVYAGYVVRVPQIRYALEAERAFSLTIEATRQ